MNARKWLALLLLALPVVPAAAACRDNVVLVHGNARAPSDFAYTYNELIARGYTASQIYRPSWGSASCPACNDHSGSEETPVRSAINTAIANSCTGKIDVIGHSMGATLAAKQILDQNIAHKIDAFVGVAGAFRGLWSCGSYPYNVANSTCGYWGLSVGSPFLDSIHNRGLAARVVHSLKSYSDEVVCYGGVCTVGGVHSSSITPQTGTSTYTYGHFGLLYYTAAAQADLIQ